MELNDVTVTLYIYCVTHEDISILKKVDIVLIFTYKSLHFVV